MELRLAVCDLVEMVAETIQDHQAAHPARLITLDLPAQDTISGQRGSGSPPAGAQ